MMAWAEEYGLLFRRTALTLLCIAWAIFWFLLHHFMAVEQEEVPEVGAKVRLIRARSNPKLDGVVGTCEEWVEEHERWRVRFENGEVKFLKPAQLERFDVSQRVSNSRGLSSRGTTSAPGRQTTRSWNTTRGGSVIGGFERGKSAGQSGLDLSSPAGEWQNSTASTRSGSHRSTTEQHNFDPALARPAVVAATSGDMVGLHRFQRQLWRNLLYCLAVSVAGTVLVCQTALADSIIREVLCSLSWRHQLVFTMEFGHRLNKLWEDSSTGTYLSLGISSPEYVLCPFFQCCTVRVARVLGRCAYHLLMLCAFGFILSSDSLGGVGVLLLFSELPTALIVWRDLAFSVTQVPPWMRTVPGVQRRWCLSYVWFFVAKLPLALLWGCFALDESAVARCSSCRQLTSSSRSAFWALVVLLTASEVRTLMLMRSAQATDVMWAATYSRSSSRRVSSGKSRFNISLFTRSGSVDTLASARSMHVDGRASTRSSCDSAAAEVIRPKPKTQVTFSLAQDETEEEAHEGDPAACSADEAVEITCQASAANEWHALCSMAVPQETTTGRVRHLGVAGRIVRDTNERSFFTIQAQPRMDNAKSDQACMLSASPKGKATE